MTNLNESFRNENFFLLFYYGERKVNKKYVQWSDAKWSFLLLFSSCHGINKYDLLTSLVEPTINGGDIVMKLHSTTEVTAVRGWPTKIHQVQRKQGNLA